MRTGQPVRLVNETDHLWADLKDALQGRFWRNIRWPVWERLKRRIKPIINKQKGNT